MNNQKTIVTNSTSLSKSLMEVYNDLRMGKIKPSEAKEIANVAGKIIKNEALNIVYKQLTGHEEPLEYLEKKKQIE